MEKTTVYNRFQSAITKKVESKFGLFVCTNATEKGCYRIERDNVTFYECGIYRAIQLLKQDSWQCLAVLSVYNTGSIYYMHNNQVFCL